VEFSLWLSTLLIWCLPATLVTNLNSERSELATSWLLLLLLTATLDGRKLLLCRRTELRMLSTPEVSESLAPLVIPGSVGTTKLLGLAETHIDLSRDAVTDDLAVIAAVKAEGLRGTAAPLPVKLQAAVKGGA
jgi:hypothetical protein